MSQSSPEGIVLKKGSQLISAELSINKEKVFTVKQETLEELCDRVLNYLYPNCKREMSGLQYTNAINSLKLIAEWQAERMHKFINNENNHTKGELGNSCIDAQTLLNFIKQFKKK